MFGLDGWILLIIGLVAVIGFFCFHHFGWESETIWFTVVYTAVATVLISVVVLFFAYYGEHQWTEGEEIVPQKLGETNGKAYYYKLTNQDGEWGYSFTDFVESSDRGYVRDYRISKSKVEVRESDEGVKFVEYKGKPSEFVYWYFGEGLLNLLLGDDLEDEKYILYVPKGEEQSN